MSRNAGVERARAVAIVAVVAAHGIMAYMTTPVGWAVADAPGSIVVDGIIWLVHAFVMPAFFVLSGFAAAQTLLHYGTGGFVQRRLRKLVLPFVVLLWPNSELLSAIWRWGRHVSALTTDQDIGAIEHHTDYFALGHLWFLYYLISYSALAVAAWQWPRLRAWVAQPRWSLSTLVLLVTPLFALILGWQHTTEIDTPQRLVPSASAWLFHLVCFAAGFVGTAPGAEPGLPRAAQRRGWLLAIAALLLFAALVPSLSARSAAPVWYASVLSAAVGAMLIAAFFDVQSSTALPPRLGRIAHASYWTYILHLPIVSALQVALFPLAVPWPLKGAIVVGVTSVICLRSWRWAQRSLLRHVFA